MDAEDAVQEAFVKLARRTDLQREQLGTLAWLFAVVRNQCLRFLRRAQLLRQRLLQLAGQPLVCAALELSEPAMKSRLHRARALLRQALLKSVSEAEDGS